MVDVVDWHSAYCCLCVGGLDEQKMRYIGWAFVTLMLAGMVGLIDFHVCIKQPGECSIKEKTHG